jgi:hypothetical protein
VVAPAALNGAMWVIRFQGEKLLPLATPQQRFNGWLYSIQQTTSHGLRDLVLGWHMGGGETPLPLSYFRFDGTSYHRIGAAIKTTNEDGIEKIIPKPASSGIGMEFTPPNSRDSGSTNFILTDPPLSHARCLLSFVALKRHVAAEYHQNLERI